MGIQAGRCSCERFSWGTFLANRPRLMFTFCVRRPSMRDTCLGFLGLAFTTAALDDAVGLVKSEVSCSMSSGSGSETSAFVRFGLELQLNWRTNVDKF